MNDIKDLCLEIIKRSKDKEAYYHYGLEHSSDQPKPTYKAYIGFSKEGVSPLHFSEASKKLLITQMNNYLDSPHPKDVTIRYHESMAQSMQRIQDFHIDAIKAFQAQDEKKKLK